MNRLFVVPALALTLFASACDKEVDPAKKSACEEFAKHLAEVAQKDQGETVPQEQVDKMVEATVGTCLEHPPSDDAMKCAMAAQDLKAMKACDEAAKDEKKEEKKEG